MPGICCGSLRLHVKLNHFLNFQRTTDIRCRKGSAINSWKKASAKSTRKSPVWVTITGCADIGNFNIIVCAIRSSFSGCWIIIYRPGKIVWTKTVLNTAKAAFLPNADILAVRYVIKEKLCEYVIISSGDLYHSSTKVLALRILVWVLYDKRCSESAYLVRTFAW